MSFAPKVILAAILIPMFAGVVEAAPARSDFLANLGSGISRKADERYASRWTLADWFETQRRTRLQDMWLASNKSDDLYEFYVGGRTGVRQVSENGSESSVRPRANQALAGAYATLVGVESRYFDFAGPSSSENSQNAYGWEALFGFRPLGDSMQNSNLTLFYGLNFRDEIGGSLQNPTAKVRMTLYLTKAFGIEGHYQWIFKGESGGVSGEGSEVEGSVFLDFSLVRIFGAWSQDVRTRVTTATSARVERRRESVDVGLKIFF